MRTKFVCREKNLRAMAHSWDDRQTLSQEDEDCEIEGRSPPHGSSPNHNEDFEHGSPLRGMKRKGNDWSHQKKNSRRW